MHPLGKSPVLVVEEDGTKVTLPESGAIVEFLCERYADGALSVPASPHLADYDARANYLQWLHWAEGSATPPFIQLMIFTLIPKSAPWFVRPVAAGICGTVIAGFVMPTIRSNLKFVEEHLKDKDFFVGGKLTGADSESRSPPPACYCPPGCDGGEWQGPSAGAPRPPPETPRHAQNAVDPPEADTHVSLPVPYPSVMLSFVAEAVEALPDNGAQAYPNFLAWHAKLKQRPAYKTADTVGKPNEFSYFLS